MRYSEWYEQHGWKMDQDPTVELHHLHQAYREFCSEQGFTEHWDDE